MQKLVLAYNFSAERIAALKLACMLVKSPLKVVAREQLLQPLGYLAGVPGLEPVDEEYSGVCRQRGGRGDAHSVRLW